ncbi:uncharacterized protein [Channa argus]|uniref:uncharacterized protein isoform X2 n=1 Tax=Channa argus TaxID=215402 RepID=UPI00352304D9
MQKKQEKTEKSSFSWVAATDQPIATAADVKKVFNFFPPATSSTETTNKPLNVFAGGASRQRRKKAQPKLEAGSLEMSDAIKPGDPAPSTQPGITTDAFRVNRTNTPFALPSVHQVALLTHVDQICPETAKDVSQVYKSCIIKEMIGKAGALLGMSTSYILPVKNYSSELDLDVNTDVLLLNAVDHILQYANLYFQDKCTGTKIMI